MKMADSDSQLTDSAEMNKERSEVLPKLYSKRVIYSFSVIFSTIFGAVILMSNLKQVNDNRARWEVLIFGIIFTLGTALTLTTIELKTNLGIPLNILGGVILNEFFWNRSIGKDAEFEKKSWHKPAIISALISLPFVLALFSAA
ncbi:hypothetical protein NE848_04545 [Gramella jeungdoensis]|uniref:Uncharacterized protein n=1 Tax=Gramella jeungdoensis TaxID=708091 RepID=A0ABT0Z045_9FLAO|nr:hypothetical protein [Gramella jeungdoensis]MCM8568635.1 hypothetical protein [Gramella jeungdoensis]